MITNEYLLDVDIKRTTAVQTPIFRRGDTAVLKFRIHDNNINNPVKKFDKAEITIVMPSGITLRETCQKENISGVDIARFQFQKIHSIEVGIYQIYLTIFTGADRISVPSIPIELTDNSSDADYEFEEIILDMQKELDTLKAQINAGIPLDSINKPNGIAGLDGQRKIPQDLFPDFFTNHINTSMFKDGAHGFMFDENGNPKVLINGNWEDAFFSEYPIGGGSIHNPPEIEIDNGNITITFPVEITVLLKKWDKGIRDVAWFKTNGTVFTGNGFTVTETGNYTLYYQLSDGKEYIVTFQVRAEDLVPDPKVPVKTIPNGSVVYFGGTEWIVLDSQKGMMVTKGFVIDKPFDESGTGSYNPQNQENIGYWLNNDFMQRFNISERSSILEKSWNIGNEMNESASVINAQVGLLTFTDANRYQNILQKHPLFILPTLSTQNFLILTEDSSDNSKTWSVNDTVNPMSAESISKNTIAKVRPVIYVDGNTRLTVVTEDEVIPFEQFKDGDIVKFSNMKWKIIDKSKRLIMYHDDNIRREFKNIRKWLGSNFFYSLTSQAQSFIQNTEYNMQEMISSEEIIDKKEFSFITLPSLKTWIDYKETSMSHLKDTKFLLSSLYVSGFTGDWCVVINPDINSGFGEYWRSSIDRTSEMVLPMLTLKENATVGSYNIKTSNIEQCKFGEQIVFSGYTWRYVGNNNLILESRFKYDQYNHIDTYTNYIEDQGFIVNSTKPNNIGYRANVGFLINQIYNKNIDSLQQTTLNTGFINNEQSVSSSFKVGLVSNKDWINNFSLELFQFLGIEEDFWLLNWKNATTAQYVQAATGKILDADPTVSKKLFKPIVKLTNGTKVDLYEKNISKYAYIPDPVVRGQLNLNLKKGTINNPDFSQITIEEMQSITFFDSLNLIEASDLTGLELLTNCTFIRMGHNSSLPFNIVDFSPLIQLGKSKTLTRLDIYGVPENNASLVVYNQLKSKFPQLNEGGVYTNAHEKVLISLAELKGLVDGVYIKSEDEAFPYRQNSEGLHTGYSYVSTFYAWGKSPITHIKGFTESDYVALNTPVWEYATFTRSQFQLPSLQTDTDTVLYQAWVKDGDGNELKIFMQFTDNWGIYWNDRDMKPHIVITRKKATETENLVLPNVINSIPMYSFGHMGGGILNSQKTIRNLTIPSNYKEIWDVFSYCYGLNNVYIANQQIKFNDKNRAFMKPSYSFGETRYDLIFHAAQNSTIFDFYQYKINTDNPQYYKFNLI